MATNTDTGWILEQAMFQNAIEGEDLKNRLITCLKMLNESHTLRVKGSIKGRQTTYTFINEVDKKNKKYKVIVRKVAIFNDGVEDVPLQGEIQYDYSDKYSSKKKADDIDDRMSIYHNGNKWNVELKLDSNEHSKGYKISWDKTEVNSQGNVMFETTFPAIT